MIDAEDEPEDEPEDDEPEPLPRNAGPFTLVALINRGGMGQVFRAVGPDSREVALKEVRPKFSRSPVIVERFRREVRALGQLSHHPNVVGFVAADAEGPRPFLAMEYLANGTDLTGYKPGGVLPFAEAAALIAKAAEGLQHLCDHGIVHRDIKPSNLVWVPDAARPATPAEGCHRTLPPSDLGRSLVLRVACTRTRRKSPRPNTFCD